MDKPPASLVMARLMQDPSPGAKTLLKKLDRAVDDFWCPECGFRGEPGLAMGDQKIILFCPVCSGKATKPDSLKAKA